MQKCTRSDGGYAKCPECGKTVWWEPFTAGCSVAAGGVIDKNVHYYLDGDLNRNSSVTFGGTNQKTETVKFVFDLYGRTITRIGTETFDAETGESKGFSASGGVLSVSQGNTLTIINTTKKVGGIVAAEGVRWTGAVVLMQSSSDTKPKADDPATEANETQAQIDSLGYDTAKFDESATLIIKAGIFDASKAYSTYASANSGVVSVGGNLIVKGGEIIGIKSSSTNIASNAAAIGTWGGSNVTIEGGIVRGCPVEEGDVAGPGGAAISANSSNGVIKITGGEIIGSYTSGAEGSAIYNGNAELIITGGTIRGGILSNAASDIQISGKPVITDEYNGGITPAKGKIAVGTLETGASIYLNTTGVFTTDFETEEAADAVKAANYFKAATPILRLEKALATGEYRCLYGHTTKEQCEAASCEEEITFWKAWTDPEKLPASGNYYLATDVTVSANTSVGNLVLDLNGHTITRDVFKGNDPLVFHAGQDCDLRLCDSSATPGKIVGVVNGFDGAITTSAGLLSSSSPKSENGEVVIPGGDITIERITVDGSAFTSAYATANTGVVVAGGDLVITNATVMGFTTNTKGNGTAIGSWGSSSVTINGDDTLIIGGNANSTTSGKGQGGVIALGNGPLTINGGTFKVYEGTGSTKHGGIIMNNGGAKAIITINGGTFYGNTCTARGAVIHSSSYPIYINGGTFYAAKTTNGGILCSTGNAFITGGTFIGVGSDSANRANSGGLIYSSGNLTITGGVFKNGNDMNGGCNILYEGNETKTLTIAGTADIAGEVMLWRGASATTQTTLVVGGKALVDYTRGDFSKSRNFRLSMVKVYLNEVGETPIADLTNTSTILHSLTYDCAGNVTGIIAENAPKMDDHDFDATGKCTKCGEQAEGETRCVNGHATAAECEAAGCTAEIKFFRVWEETTSLPTSGAWYLTENVTVAKSTAVTGDLELDLNGKTITRTAAADNIEVYTAGLNDLRLGDSTATPGSIVVDVTGIEGGIVKSVTGLLTNSSPVDGERGALIIDRITVDASAVQDNLYVGNWKTTSTNTTEVALKDANDKVLVYLTKALEEGGVPQVSVAINAGAVVVGGDLVINGATIKGYQHTQGCGTAIGTWGSAAVTINEGSVIIGGSANAVGSKNLFGTENDFTAISGLGEGGVIAMGKADLTINGGEFKTYDRAVTKHGAVIALKAKGATINGGTFYGATATANGGVINHGSFDLTINGGTFYAGTADQGGAIRGSGMLTITGGEFIGTGSDTTKQSNYGGVIYNNGSAGVVITGGTIKNGYDRQGGYNVYYAGAGTLTIAGDAKVAGEVLVKCTSARAKLVLGGKALVDFNTEVVANEFNKGRNIRLNNVDVYIGDATGTPVYTANTTGTGIKPTYDAAGNVTGVANY